MSGQPEPLAPDAHLADLDAYAEASRAEAA